VDEARLGKQPRQGRPLGHRVAGLLDDPARALVVVGAKREQVVEQLPAGGFGLVVGVDRRAAAEGLLRVGADITCSDLRRLWPGA